jgi:SnoaL-like domain
MSSADRLAIRELVDAYARCADRRDTEGQKSLFTEDTHFVVSFVKQEGTWRFGERRLYVDWTETRTVGAGRSGE